MFLEIINKGLNFCVNLRTLDGKEFIGFGALGFEILILFRLFFEVSFGFGELFFDGFVFLLESKRVLLFFNELDLLLELIILVKFAS